MLETYGQLEGKRQSWDGLIPLFKDACEIMSHSLEIEYGLTADEILTAIEKRFRAKVALEGAVAEVQMGKHLKALLGSGTIARFEEHDTDGYHDFTIWLPDGRCFRLECKNVRDSTEAFRLKGQVVAYKVETQKTRTSNEDPSSRFYNADQFDILGVCLGKKTKDWTRFLYVDVRHLARHSKYPNKLAPIQRVPLPDSLIAPPWYPNLESLLKGV